MRERATTVNQKTIKELCALYTAAFQEWKKVLKKGGRVVVVFPVWIFRNKKTFLPCLEEIKRIGFANITIPSELAQFITEKTDRGSIIIARENQHVGRELFVFERK
jgi:tRNA G10  N-methylase Trm11